MFIQAIDEASKLHVKHKMLLDSYFLEKGAKPFIGKTSEKLNNAENIHIPLRLGISIPCKKKITLTGGDSASIADLLCAATLDQTKEAGASVSHINLDKRRHKR